MSCPLWNSPLRAPNPEEHRPWVGTTHAFRSGWACWHERPMIGARDVYPHEARGTAPDIPDGHRPNPTTTRPAKPTTLRRHPSTPKAHEIRTAEDTAATSDGHPPSIGPGSWNPSSHSPTASPTRTSGPRGDHEARRGGWRPCPHPEGLGLGPGPGSDPSPATRPSRARTRPISNRLVRRPVRVPTISH